MNNYTTTMNKKTANYSRQSTGIGLKGINSIGDDSYFLRLTDRPDHFIHPDPSLETRDEAGYRVNKGAEGAAVFHKAQAKNFIKMSGAPNLEMVRVKDVLGNDNSTN